MSKIKAFKGDEVRFFEVSNPIQISVIAYKYDRWEYVL